MTYETLRRAAACIIALLMPLAGVGCSMLDVSDPTAIEEKDYANATGANMLRREALTRLYDAMSDAAFQSGMLADEFFFDPRLSDLQVGLISANHAIDLRDASLLNRSQPSRGGYQKRNDARLSASFAMESIRKYAPQSVSRPHIGQMFLVRGYTVLGLAEHFCAGLPLDEVVNYRPVYGAPLSTDELFERAHLDLDSAVVYAADSSRIADAARVSRARALLGLGKFAEAAASAAPVPTDYVWRTEFTSNPFLANTLLNFGYLNSLYWNQGVADREGGNGLDFVSANDPRLETRFLRMTNDGMVEIRAMEKYPDNFSQIVLASGVEARLIEAEAQLNGAAPGDWLASLNDLRQTAITPAMPPLTDPGTQDARVDLLFRERAFWLFGTGHRLGDLRRLVRHYGRDPESVFPSGPHRLGDNYGTATSLAFPWVEAAVQNPAITGCTDR
jgi:hypothetical protein